MCADKPRLSVVIPTFNRRERLVRVLSALDAQQGVQGAFEVVVVDDGSSDGTSEWLRQQRFTFALKPLFQNNSGPARARNAGVAAAGAELLLFLDDDVVPDPTLVAEHLASHEQRQNVAVIGPLASLAHYPQVWVAWEQFQVEKQYDAMQRGDWEPSFRQFWTGNASVPKAKVTAAGGFNPEFLRAEDIELALRMSRQGLGFVFNPKARGVHHAERSLKSWMTAHTSYGALAVRMLETGPSANLERMLAEDWARLNSSMAFVLKPCLLMPAARSPVVSALERSLLIGGGRGGILKHRACSLLANLLYWSAVAERLGAEKTRRVMSVRRTLVQQPPPA